MGGANNTLVIVVYMLGTASFYLVSATDLSTRLVSSSRYLSHVQLPLPPLPLYRFYKTTLSAGLDDKWTRKQCMFDIGHIPVIACDADQSEKVGDS